MLMAAGHRGARARSRIHGYLLLGEHKMSKSLGNVIEPFQVADVYGADALRFYVLREVSFGADGEVSPEGFETRYTTELANEYGNLASRTLAMIERYRDGVVPSAEPPAELAAEFDGLADAVAGAHRRGRAHRRARRDLAARQAAQPLRAGRGAVAARQGRGRRPTASTRCSTRSPRGCAWSRCCCTRSCPDSAERLLAALGREDLSLDGARARRGRAAARRSASSGSSSRASRRPRRSAA